MGNYLYFLICLQGAVNAVDIWSNQDEKYIQYYLNYRFGVYENQRKTAEISKEEIFIIDKLTLWRKSIVPWMI